MRSGKNLGLQIIETAVDGKMSAKTYLDIDSANLDELDFFVGRINSEIKKIKESPSVVYIKANKETDGIYAATVPTIKDLIVDGLYIVSLNQPNNIGAVNLRINGTISKNLNKVDVDNNTLTTLSSNDLLANFEYFFRYNGDVFVLDNSNSLSFNGKEIDKFVLKEEVVDNVTSGRTDVPFSANQGKVLNERVTTVVENLTDKIDSNVIDINTRIDSEVVNINDRVNLEVENINAGLDLRVKKSEIGVANGVAPTDENNIIPSLYLPSYVDDVLEFDYRDISQTSGVVIEGKTYFPEIGESGKIYLDISEELTYRWGGSQYAEISKSLALGETSSTAYAGDKGKKNTSDIELLNINKIDKVTSATAGNLAVFSTDGILADSGQKNLIFATASDLTSHLNDKNNPHEVDKVQVGLENVDNVKQSTATNLLNGAAVGSLRAIGSVPESETYSMGNHATSFGLSKASGIRATALGNSEASGTSSLSMGQSAIASGSNSFAGGNGSKASGSTAFAMGGFTEAAELYSSAFGQKSIALGLCSHVKGSYSIAQANYSIAIGSGSIASPGSCVHVSSFSGAVLAVDEKYINLAAMFSKLAVGQDVYIYNINSSSYEVYKIAAFDSSAKTITVDRELPTSNFNTNTLVVAVKATNNSYQAAIGRDCKALSLGDIALGYDAVAQGSYSVAVGMGVISNAQGQVVVGKYNDTVGSSSLFVVGVGSNDTARKTGFRVDANGKAYTSEGEVVTKSTKWDGVLFSAFWLGSSSPFTYEWGLGVVTATSLQEVFLPPTITKEQIEAAQAANILDGGQKAGAIIFKAWGEKPTVDIPISVIIRRDL